jgi:hypothetical protein
LINKYKNSFSLSEYDLGRVQRIKHKIRVESKPIKQNPYKCPMKLRPVLENKVQELLNNNLIEPSTSPWSSPIILVKKKDDTYRFCVDFRKLNAETIKDAYRIPCPEEQLDALVKAKYFSCLDLASGFWLLANRN